MYSPSFCLAPHLKRSQKFYREVLIIYYWIVVLNLIFVCAYFDSISMASPEECKGQHRGACGHIMAAFHMYERCACCRDNKLGHDPRVQDKPCSICDNISDSQRETLSTPSYRICKDRKEGLLVSPKEVTIMISPLRRFLSRQHRICSHCAGFRTNTCHIHLFYPRCFLCYLLSILSNDGKDG